MPHVRSPDYRTAWSLSLSLRLRLVILVTLPRYITSSAGNLGSPQFHHYLAPTSGRLYGYTVDDLAVECDLLHAA